jgi:hypothetical protein
MAGFPMATGSAVNRQFFAYLYSERSQPVGSVTLLDLRKPNMLFRNDLVGRQRNPSRPSCETPCS